MANHPVGMEKDLMGAYTGGPVTVYETKYVFVKPEDLTVEKLRDLLNDDEFYAPPNTAIEIGKAGAKRDGFIELSLTYPILEA